MANPLIKAFTNFGSVIRVSPSSTDVANPFTMRATSFNLNEKQEVEPVETIDGAVDATLYKLGGNMVDGSIAMPLIHEGQSLNLQGPKANCSPFTSSLAEAFWKLAASRDVQGRMKYYADIDCVYPDNSHFTFRNCFLNKLGMKVGQGEAVEVSTDWIGKSKDQATQPFNKTPNYLSPARQVVWADFDVLVYSNGSYNRIPSNASINGEGFREFEVNLDNQIDRAFTLNGSYNPQDIYAKKRRIEGSIKLLGRSKYLNTLGTTNQNFFTSDEFIAFGYRIGTGNIYWATVLNGCLFRKEEMSLNATDIFESTIAFRAMGDCGFSFEALQKGVNLNQATLPTASINTYGGASRGNQPGQPFETAAMPFDGW